MKRRTTTSQDDIKPVCHGTIAPSALGGAEFECFTFTTEVDRSAFIHDMIYEVGFVPQYATALDAEHDGPDRFLVAVRLPGASSMREGEK
jgi:hypothetical protein